MVQQPHAGAGPQKSTGLEETRRLMPKYKVTYELRDTHTRTITASSREEASEIVCAAAWRLHKTAVWDVTKIAEIKDTFKETVSKFASKNNRLPKVVREMSGVYGSFPDKKRED